MYLAAGRHRASSDPLSRGGAFPDGAGLLQQEPNPFEQSFGPQASTSRPTDGTLTAGGRRARSTSPSALLPRATPGGLQRLPPLSLMQTPGGELSAFNWGVDSLRTGPLSPALLNGPTGTSALFESSLRTGLTPFVASVAPNGTAGGGVSFPPPSPATAALFAMMTNNTPGTSDAAALAGGGPRPHEGLNEANSFDASFAQANSTQHSKLRNSLHASDSPVDMNGAPQPASTAGRTTRSASNIPVAPHPPPPGVSYPHQGPPGSHVYYPSGPHANAGVPPHGPPGAPPPGYTFPPHARHPHPHPHAHSQDPLPPPGAPHPHFTGPPGQLAFTAPPPPTNPLDLLTQASFHNDDAVAAAAALSGLATPGGGFPAAAVLAAAQQQGAAGGIMPSSTVTGGSGVVETGPANGGPARKDSSPAPSAGSSAGGGTGRAKRGAAATGAAVSNVPAKRARKPTAAAAAAAEEMSLGLDDEEVAASSTKKVPAKRGGRKAAATAAKKEDPDTDGMSVSANGSVPPEAHGGEYHLEGSEAPSGPSKGGRGRKKDTGETEEEKRRNFLERNRQAALKCRQRKKAWLQSLQTKVELLTTDNDALQTTVNNLKEEVNSLRAILAAHASCPVALGNVPPAPLPPGMTPIDPRRAAMPGMPPGTAPPAHAGHPPASIPPGYAPRAVYQ
ncbi:Transcription factor [Rhodotorula toruloides]